MNYGKCKQCGRTERLDDMEICGYCRRVRELTEDNLRLKQENQYLKDTACEIMEEELYIEPCPICGKEMVDGGIGPVHKGASGKCPFCSSNTTEAHNVIARLLESVCVEAETYPNDISEELTSAVDEFLTLQAKVQRESE